MRLIYSLIYLFVIFSCTEINTSDPKTSFRDSILNFYKEESSLNDRIDTTEFSYKLINAYTANDSAALNRLLLELLDVRENRKRWGQMDSCIGLKSLASMNIDEGYRFSYDGAFCNYRQITTIYKQNDSIKLNFLLYQLIWENAKCKKLEEFDRVLTADNWEEFLHKIDQGDFWGLKSDNGRQGLDGSTWTTTGYKKAKSQNLPSQYHFVHRWGQTSLHEAFELATILAANKKGCLTMRRVK
jgi:hypothetical protein